MKKTDNRIVAYFDIMGFKNLVQNSTHREILSKMTKISDYINNIDNSKFIAYGAKSKIRTLIFSDSIILVSENKTISSAMNIIIHASFLISYCFEIGMPIKGCISYGKFTADFENSLFFGQPLIDAYLLEDELNVYSVVLHHTFETKFSNSKYGGQELSMSRRWFNYDTPLKGGVSKHYHVNWLFYELYDYEKKKFIWNKNKNDKIFKLVDQFYSKVSGKPRIYVDNTKRLVGKLIEYTIPNNVKY